MDFSWSLICSVINLQNNVKNMTITNEKAPHFCRVIKEAYKMYGHYSEIMAIAFILLSTALFPISHLETGKTFKNLAGLSFHSAIILRDEQVQWHVNVT